MDSGVILKAFRRHFALNDDRDPACEGCSETPGIECLPEVKCRIIRGDGWLCIDSIIILCLFLFSDEAEITGSTNLLNYYQLESSYNRYFNKKVKEELSTFLPHLPGNIDSPGIQDNRYNHQYHQHGQI